MNTAVVSAHIFQNDSGKDIEIFSIVHDDKKGTGIFDDINHALLDVIEPKFDSQGSYFFIAIVKSDFVEHRNWEGVEYDVEHEIQEINDIEQFRYVSIHSMSEANGGRNHTINERMILCQPEKKEFDESEDWEKRFEIVLENNVKYIEENKRLLERLSHFQNIAERCFETIEVAIYELERLERNLEMPERGYVRNCFNGVLRTLREGADHGK